MYIARPKASQQDRFVAFLLASHVMSLNQCTGLLRMTGYNVTPTLSALLVWSSLLDIRGQATPYTDSTIFEINDGLKC